MRRKFRKPIALFTSLAALAATALVMFTVPAGAATPQPEQCQVNGCSVGGGSGTYTPLAGDFNLGTSFSPQVPGLMAEACYPFNSLADASDPMTLWTDGNPTSLGNAGGNGCVFMGASFAPGHTYTVSYESTSGTYLENSNPGGDTGSSPDPNLPYSGARYSAGPGASFPTLVGGGDWQVQIFVYTFPVSPPDVTLFQANDATVHLAFTGDGDPFATFDVSCTSTVGGTFTATGLLQSDSPIQITGMGQVTPLTPPGFTPITYNTVTCSVSEFNLGSGPAAIVSAQLVPTSGPGCPATDVTAPTALSSASEAFPGAVVSWKPATATPQNCINGYQITPFAGTGALAPITVNGVNSTSVVVTGLTEGSTYTFTVAAITGSGVGPQSDPTGPVTIGTPATPSSVSASKVMNGAIKVSFKAPKNNGAAIAKYTAKCTSSNGGTTRSWSHLSTHVTVRRLTPGKKYTCTVTATNSRGTGRRSAASNAVKA